MKPGFLLIVAIVLGFFAGGVGTASSAQRINLSVTDAWYMQASDANFDVMVPGQVALDPGGEPLKLSGVLDQSGNFTIPADRFEVNPVDGVLSSLGVSISYRAAADITGNYSAKTGVMTMSAPMEYVFRYGVPTDPDFPPALDEPLNCAFGGFDSTYQTSGSVLTNSGTFAGKSFANGNGQLLGGWSVPISTLLENARGIEGSSTLDCLSGAFGDDVEGKSLNAKLWLRADVTLADIPSVKMSFQTRRTKVTAGKSTSVRLRLQNLTGSRTTVKVGLKSSNQNVKVKKSLNVSVPARSVFITDVRVNATKKAKGTSKITASAEGRQTVSTVSVRPVGK